MEEKKKIQGKRLKEIRKILGKTQESFCEWLTNYGITGNYNEPYKSKTIAAWEAGRRNVPNEVKKVISDNVTVDGFPVQFAYLNGDTDFITQSFSAIVKHSEGILHSFASNPSEWKQATCDDVQQMANSPLNQFALVFLNEILPIFNHSKNDIFDIMRFIKYMYDENGKLIEIYINEECQGK